MKLLPLARKAFARAVFNASIGNLSGEIIPDFRRDKPCRLRLGHDRGNHIVAVEIAGAAEEGFLAVVMDARAINELLRLLVQRPAGQGARGLP